MEDSKLSETLKLCTEGTGVVVHQMNQNFAVVGQVINTGAAHMAELIRLGFEEHKRNISFAQGTGQRIVTEAGAGQTRRQTEPQPPQTGGTGGV